MNGKSIKLHRTSRRNLSGSISMSTSSRRCVGFIDERNLRGIRNLLEAIGNLHSGRFIGQGCQRSTAFICKMKDKVAPAAMHGALDLTIRPQQFLDAVPETRYPRVIVRRRADEYELLQ